MLVHDPVTSVTEPERRRFALQVVELHLQALDVLHRFTQKLKTWDSKQN